MGLRLKSVWMTSSRNVGFSHAYSTGFAMLLVIATLKWRACFLTAAIFQELRCLPVREEIDEVGDVEILAAPKMEEVLLLVVLDDDRDEVVG